MSGESSTPRTWNTQSVLAGFLAVATIVLAGGWLCLTLRAWATYRAADSLIHHFWLWASLPFPVFAAIRDERNRRDASLASAVP